jgi:hypothetical protein
METTWKQNSNQFLCLLLRAIKDLTPCWKLKTKIWKIWKDNKNKSLLKLHRYVKITHVVTRGVSICLLKLHPFVRITHVVTRGVSHCGLPIYIKKCLKAKKELWEFKYFNMKKLSSSKNCIKETKILQDIITL